MAYAEFPYKDAIAVPENSRDPLAKNLPKLKAGDKFRTWLSGLSIDMESRPKRNAKVNLQAQGAALANTPLPIGDVVQGIWRICVSVRVTRPATVNSSVRVTIAWTERGVAQTELGTLVNGNLTTSRDGRVFIIRSDADTPISYSTAYATAGATTMQYSLDLVAELLAGD